MPTITQAFSESQSFFQFVKMQYLQCAVSSAQQNWGAVLLYPQQPAQLGT